MHNERNTENPCTQGESSPDSEPLGADHQLAHYTLDLGADAGEVLSSIRGALRDGAVTEPERREIARELVRVESVVAAIRHELEVGHG